MQFFKTKQQKHDEEFMRGWNSVNPFDKHVKKLDKMSDEEIAEYLSKCVINTPPYILLDHELKCRIAQIPARSNYFGIAAMLLGIILGWALAQWKPLEPKTSLDIIADHLKRHDESCPDNRGNNDIGNKMQPRPTTKDIPIQPVRKPESKIKTYQTKQQESNAETK